VPRIGRRPIGLGLVLACLAATIVLGAAVKAPCASGNWADGRQYTRLCYSDIVPLLGTEQLMGGRLPYLDACAVSQGQCDEYPVLSMYAMRLAAWASNRLPGFFWANVILLSLAAAVVAVCLYLLVGPRALMFALAPTLLIYGFMNWDLLTVALATGATLAYVNRRDVWSGVFLGLGASAKVYPALLVVPFVLGRFREREPDRGIHLAWAAAGAWIAVNVPFAIAAPGGWFEFYRFNAERPADWDSLWFIVHHRVTGEEYFGATTVINAGSALAFVALSATVWLVRRRIEPDFPRWSLGFPLLVAFLLTNKVYSPQYGLWLLPWFALAVPRLRTYLAFEAADVAVFVTRFSWFGRYSGFGGVPIGAFEIAVVIRALVLVWCLVEWTRARAPVEATTRLVPATSPA
jgi:uncharacterized protein (TIGR03382 family)